MDCVNCVFKNESINSCGNKKSVHFNKGIGEITSCDRNIYRLTINYENKDIIFENIDEAGLESIREKSFEIFDFSVSENDAESIPVTMDIEICREGSSEFEYYDRDETFARLLIQEDEDISISLTKNELEKLKELSNSSHNLTKREIEDTIRILINEA